MKPIQITKFWLQTTDTGDSTKILNYGNLSIRSNEVYRKHQKVQNLKNVLFHLHTRESIVTF